MTQCCAAIAEASPAESKPAPVADVAAPATRNEEKTEASVQSGDTVPVAQVDTSHAKSKPAATADAAAPATRNEEKTDASVQTADTVPVAPDASPAKSKPAATADAAAPATTNQDKTEATVQTGNIVPVAAVDQRLGKLEARIFVHQYPKETPGQRLHRLETFVFGKDGTGDMDARIEKLSGIFKISATATAAGAGAESASAAGVPPAASSSSKSAEQASKEPSTATAASSATAQAKETAMFPSASSSSAGPASQPKSLIAIMNEGIDNYNRHRYHNSEENFEECCEMAPGFSRVHAYLAIAKLQLSERKPAIEEFRTCYELDPFGTYGRYAKNCLIVLAGDEAIRARKPVDSKKVLDAAIDKINHQSDSETRRHGDEAAPIARQRMMSATSHRGTFYSSNGATDGYVQSRAATNEATLRAAYAQESANNLKHLLATKRMPGDANLRAWGTNLNTRYYGDETYLLAPYYIPREYPLQLRASPKSFSSLSAPQHKPAKQVSTNKKRTHGASGSKKKKTR